MKIDPQGNSLAPSEALAELRLLQLADSALPTGGLAHSFGLESLVAEGLLDVDALRSFLTGHLAEGGTMEAVFCRAAFRLIGAAPETFPAERWLEINDDLSALKPARESRAGSASLGSHFLGLALAMTDLPALGDALSAARQARGAVHHCTAFGLAAAALGLGEDRAALAYLHQSAAALVSACQRLLPLGQRRAARTLWDLKPAMIEAAERSASCEPGNVCCFAPLLDWGAMEHPALATRLFAS